MARVSVEHNELSFGEHLQVSFHRTLRVPEDVRESAGGAQPAGERVYPLPPSFGRFPVHQLDADAAAGGDGSDAIEVVIPLREHEALWIGFDGHEWRPHAVMIGAGEINALTGEPWEERLSANPQNYLVCPEQPWLDGFKAGSGFVKQFVATPLGSGLSVEEQLGARSPAGSIRIAVFAPRPGRFPEHAPPPRAADIGHPAMGMPVDAEIMSLGEGGKIEQKLYPDQYGLDTWETKPLARATVHLLDSKQYRAVTGRDAPLPPQDAETYTREGGLWFELPEEDRNDLPASERLTGLKTVGGGEPGSENTIPRTLHVRRLNRTVAPELPDQTLTPKLHTEASMSNESADVDLDAIKVCEDKILPQSLALEAAELSITENPENKPTGEPGSERLLGVDKVALEQFGAAVIGKKWQNGRELRVRHMGGDPAIHAKVEHYAKQWESYANIKFLFVQSGPAEIRISYHLDNRSWSWLGTEALASPDNEATMHYGWLTPTLPEENVRRVILHEFGHALGMIHEHQHPEANIDWDKPVVRRYYKEKLGWADANIESNLFTRLDKHDTQFDVYDRNSIMHYPVPAEFIKGGVGINLSTNLSETDKRFIARVYPKT